MLLLATMLVAQAGAQHPTTTISDAAGVLKARAEPGAATPTEAPGGWIRTSDYPKAALAVNAQGSTNFTLKIDPSGHVSDCIVTETSGNEALDTATCTILLARARFKPATDADGQPIESRYSSHVVWQIPYPTVVYPMDVTMTYDVDKDGRASSCITTGLPTDLPQSIRAQMAGNPIPDPCDQIGTRKFATWSTLAPGGEPSRGKGKRHVVIHSTVTIENAPPN